MLHLPGAWLSCQERRAAREWRQQQESERQELRRQEQKSREEQRWQLDSVWMADVDISGILKLIMKGII